MKRITQKRIRLYWNDIHFIQRKTGKTFRATRKAYKRIVKRAGGRSETSRSDILSIVAGRKYKCPAQGAFKKYVNRYDTPDGRRDLIIFLDCVPSAHYRRVTGQKRFVFPVNIGRMTRKEAERMTDAQHVERARMKMQSSEMRIAKITLAGKGWLKDRTERKGIRLVRGKCGRKGNKKNR